MTTHEKLGTLAEKLEFANALTKQARRELSALQVERGKDAAYIAELEAKNEVLLARVEVLKGSVQSLQAIKRKSPDERASERMAKSEQQLRVCRESRDQLIAQLNRLTTAAK